MFLCSNSHFEDEFNEQDLYTMAASSDEWHGMLKRTRTHSQGYVQRASATSVGEPAITPYSNLACYLLEEYAFGGISASQLQQIA